MIDDEADPGSSNDFGKNIIPNMLAAGELLTAYRFHGYWKDVGTIDSLWDANMDMLAPHNSIDLHDPEPSGLPSFTAQSSTMRALLTGARWSPSYCGR